MVTCPSENTVAVEQTDFWSSGAIHWSPHRIGWAISGGCAALTTLFTIINVTMHARNYRVPGEQRQILRILYLPMVYGVISFLSYRFFRDYTYYSLIEVAYEALSISAFLLLLIQYVAATSADSTAESALMRKDKKKLPLPLCCWRYRPTKAYFMYTIKWAVLQYAVVRPAVSIAGIVCQALNVLCENVWSIHFASVYLTAIDFVAISIALYGLILFYGLTKEELKGKRPLAKFAAIKLIVFFTFYQNFVFELLQKHGVIKATAYWTESNIVDGLDALATTIEMVFFSLFMFWAFPASEYRSYDLGRRRPAWKAIVDSINYSDFAREIYTSLKFFFRRSSGQAESRTEKTKDEHGQVDFERAFFPNGYDESGNGRRTSDTKGLVYRNGTMNGGMSSPTGGRTVSPADDEYVTAPPVMGRYGNERPAEGIPMAPMTSGKR